MPFTITHETNKKISYLNDNLQNNCPDFQLFIVKHGGATIKLGLKQSNIEVSYLVINNDNNTFNILSKTNVGHENKGYNKFLTAVSIYLADTMNSPKNLFSNTAVAARQHILEQYIHTKTEDEYEDKLNSLFGPLWHDQMIKWVENNFPFLPLIKSVGL